MEYTKTELHTHLLGILTPQEFLEFILECDIKNIIWPFEDNKVYPVVDLLSDPSKLKKLSIDTSYPVGYDYLDLLYSNRTSMLKNVVSQYKSLKKLTSKENEKTVYNAFINACLRSLVKNGVEYVEISYSFPDRINNFIIDPDLKDKIKVRFLLSTSRSTPVKSPDPGVHTFEKCARDVGRIIGKGNAVGFDIMGQESSLKDIEKDYSDEYFSFKRKMELILEKLVTCDGSTFRIHSGETPESFNNTEIVLKYLEEIVDERGYQLPPPEIRIGHGVYFIDNEEYIRLLERFNCIIEINASSNMALSNIKSASSIPYLFYYDNNVPTVISTDGHGMYSTNTHLDDVIALREMGDEAYRDGIVEFDKEILKSKGGR